MTSQNYFLNTYELDELLQSQQETHYPSWLEDDETDDVVFDDALYGVI
jgi:hypothetical protein